MKLRDCAPSASHTPDQSGQGKMGLKPSPRSPETLLTQHKAGGSLGEAESQPGHRPRVPFPGEQRKNPRTQWGGGQRARGQKTGSRQLSALPGATASIGLDTHARGWPKTSAGPTSNKHSLLGSLVGQASIVAFPSSSQSQTRQSLTHQVGGWASTCSLAFLTHTLQARPEPPPSPQGKPNS